MRAFKESTAAALKRCADIGNIRRAKFMRVEIRQNKLVAICFVTGVTKDNLQHSNMPGWKKVQQDYATYRFRIDVGTTIHFDPSQPPSQALRIEQSLYKKDINAILGFAPLNYFKAATVIFQRWYAGKSIAHKSLVKLKQEKARDKSLSTKEIPSSALIAELAFRLKKTGMSISNSGSQLECAIGWRIRIEGEGTKRVWRSRGLEDVSINGLFVRRYNVDFVYGVLTGGSIDTFKNVMDVGWNITSLSKTLTLKNIKHSFYRKGRGAKDSKVSSLFVRAGKSLWTVTLRRINKQLVWQTTGFRISVPKNTTLDDVPLSAMVGFIKKRESIAIRQHRPTTNPYVLLRNQSRQATSELQEILADLNLPSKMLISGMELVADKFRVRLSHAFPQSKRRWKPTVPKLYWYIEFDSRYGHFEQWSMYEDNSVKNFSRIIRTLLTKAELIDIEEPVTDIQNYLPHVSKRISPLLKELEVWFKERNNPIPHRWMGAFGLGHVLSSPVDWSVRTSYILDTMVWTVNCGSKTYQEDTNTFSVGDIGNRIVGHITQALRREKFVILGDSLIPRSPGLERWFTQKARINATTIHPIV